MLNEERIIKMFKKHGVNTRLENTFICFDNSNYWIDTGFNYFAYVNKEGTTKSHNIVDIKFNKNTFTLIVKEKGYSKNREFAMLYSCLSI